MTMRPVHCCCTPGLRLGFVPVNLPGAGSVVLALKPEMRWNLNAEQPTLTREASIRVDVMELRLSNGRSFLAVHSNDHPIETWRKVNGFVEDQAVVTD